jgi:1-deoxy-D-xylulose-5-phosphate synthase
MLDRAGLTGPDGPTHHGTFDLAYLRVLPNMTVMAPGDANDLGAMLDFGLRLGSPCAIRYPKDNAVEIPRTLQPIELGKGEVLRWGTDVIIVCAGTLLNECLGAADALQQDQIQVGLINARFVKPIDKSLLRRAFREARLVVCVEEAMLMAGFGSAVLEWANASGLSTNHVRRLGIPDQFTEHGDRAELLSDLGLNAAGIERSIRKALDELQLIPRSAEGVVH